MDGMGLTNQELVMKESRRAWCKTAVNFQIGATTLERIGLVLDLFERRMIPMRMLLV
jgi:hypothetical protein